MTAAAHPYRLHEACRRGRLDMVRRLLNSSADVQDSIKRIDKFGATPLLAATGIRGYPGSEAVMHLLLDAGANPLQDIYTAGRPRDGSDEFVEESRRQQGIDLPFLVTNALTAAMDFATPALIERLFHAGVDLCTATTGGFERTPYGCAARQHGPTALHWAVLGNLNEPYVGQDPGQLHDRILLQRKKCIQALCAHGGGAATVNAQDRDGKTAMHLAVESCFPEVVACLLEQGANPNLIDSAGRTALMALAMSNNFTEMHKHVIDTLTKAMVNNLGAGDDHGNTALHLACSHYERLWIARLLIERGAPCHLTNGSGELPLHKAVALWPPSYTFARFDMFRGALQSQDQFISLLLDKTRGVCVETRLKVSNHAKQQENGKAYARLRKIDHAQIRAGFKIMPPDIQQVVEAESGVWGLRNHIGDPKDPMSLSSAWHWHRGRAQVSPGLEVWIM
ncbi:hypothetical protein G7054_g11510 [Neopestalotiopsis clavispora]|nr:hypothetical protein G7054_g11510 [Neopestalotiopsis clavispora]